MDSELERLSYYDDEAKLCETQNSVHDIVGMVVLEPFTRSNEVGQQIKLGSMPAAGSPKEAGKAFSSTMTKA